mmetsp:Transcript_103342/g.144008  ORF Transcript_103342/g.144008 Transcript_103342/m.144008 type:complete len:208 (-) Transcript_103342:464-1087(-)
MGHHSRNTSSRRPVSKDPGASAIGGSSSSSMSPSCRQWRSWRMLRSWTQTSSKRQASKRRSMICLTADLMTSSLTCRYFSSSRYRAQGLLAKKRPIGTSSATKSSIEKRKTKLSVPGTMYCTASLVASKIKVRSFSRELGSYSRSFQLVLRMCFPWQDSSSQGRPNTTMRPKWARACRKITERPMPHLKPRRRPSRKLIMMRFLIRT